MASHLVVRATKVIAHYYLRSLSRRLSKPLVKPWWVIVDITDRCFLRCPTCAKWLGPPVREELSTEEWRGIVDCLAGWLGRFHLSFTGGEPLLRQDLPELISWARRNGATTNVMTNGHLVDKALAVRLAEAGLDSVTVSLNGMTAKTHDISRDFPGSLDRAVEAVRTLRDAGRMKVSVSAILMEDNAEELVSLVDWVRSEGLDGVGIQPLVPAYAFQSHDLPGAQSQELLSPLSNRSSPVENGTADSSIGRLIKMKAEGYPITSAFGLLEATRARLQLRDGQAAPNCIAGFDNVLIDPYGEVRICNLLPPLGNARESHPRALWHSPLAEEQRRIARRCTKPCQLLACNFEDSPPTRARQFIGRLRIRKKA